MKSLVLAKITGNLPNPSKPQSPRPLTGSVLLRIDAIQIDKHRGVALGVKLDSYFAASGASPLRLAVNAENGTPGVLAHIEANNERIDTLLADEEVPVEDRKAMATFLGAMNHALKSSLLDRGPLPVAFS